MSEHIPTMNAKDLIDACERGLKKGYWHNDLIPELRKRLERNEPKKPVLISHTIHISALVDYQCPSCETIISKVAILEETCLADKRIELKYCPACGQQLDWSDCNEPND